MKTNDENGNGVPKGARFIFGIFMILFYVAIGLLFIFNDFFIANKAISCTVGGILCAYGLWRGFRLYKGMN